MISYAFRSTEKAALQEIGPRFTLKLRWMKKGLPAVLALGSPAGALEFASAEDDNNAISVEGDAAHVDEDAKARDARESDPDDMHEDGADEEGAVRSEKVRPPTQDEYIWIWKVLSHFNLLPEVRLNSS